MGWFSVDRSPEPETAAPSRSARELCWSARDAYFGCLDKNEVSVPGQESKKCVEEVKEYEKNCAQSWIDYFNKRRVMQLRQEILEREAEQVRMAGKTPAASVPVQSKVR